MSITVYVSGDAAALALGADEVAAAIAGTAAERGQAIRIVRNGSRGLFWLEPLVEVVTAQGRAAYGPVSVADVPGLFAADFTAGGKHPFHLGDIEAHPYLARGGGQGLAPLHSPPESSGRPRWTGRPARNTLFSTPTRAIPVVTDIT
jgi:hypothetical protein